MGIWRVAVFAFLLMGLGACSRERTDSNAREAGRKAHEASQELKDRTDEAARKAGKAAHELATETKEAAKKANRELKQVAGDAREGWKDAPPAHSKDKQ